VLDAEGGSCPDWHIGEIHIGGAGVADGYANDPEKTAAAFLDHPALGRIYRTGDRGRRHPDGVVEFLGRTDTQVKLNGHRVELGEIEHLLDRAPGIRGSAACVQGEGRRRRLVAYVTLTEDAPPAWRQQTYAVLRRALPYYMVPEALIALDAIPLTGNGKVDRRRLRALPADEGRPDDPAPALPAGDLLGHEIAGCWADVLGEPPGRRGFFEAGGSSYDAIRLLSLVRGRLGHEVSFGAFLADPTVPGLVELCRRARGERGSGIWAFRPRAVAAPRFRLVLFPPVGGGVSCYAGLIRALPGDVDVHVVGFDGPLAAPEAAGSGPAVPLDRLAAACLRRLPADALAGPAPLVFAGWSFGGALAFEAARGCPAPVAGAVVVDTPVSAASRTLGDPSADALLEGFLRDIRETGGAGVERADVAADPVLGARFAVYRQNMAALAAWRPHPADLPVTEVRAGDRPAEPDAGAWARVAPVAATAALTGGHFDVFRPENLPAVTDAIEGIARR
jgi:pyochelin synthetase